MRILHVGHHQIRKYGNIRVSWTQKLFFGLLRNYHCVQPFSDRDVASFEGFLGIRELGFKQSNQRLLQTAESFEPDLVMVGHCDIISNETLQEIRTMFPNVVIAGANCDPLFVPRNSDHIKHRCEVLDAMFVSTGMDELKIYEGSRARLFHMPNVVDSSIETFDSSAETDLEVDLLFCSKATDNSTRAQTVRFLFDNMPADIKFSTPGNFGQEGVWGRDYDHLLSRSKMGLNLNRQEGYQWYSSDRMVQLGGNGLLTFTHESAGFDDIFPDETLVYFTAQEDLLEKIIEFQNDDSKRRYWAKNLREFLHQEFNSTLQAQYMVEASMAIPYSREYVWLK